MNDINDKLKLQNAKCKMQNAKKDFVQQRFGPKRFGATKIRFENLKKKNKIKINIKIFFFASF